MAAPKPKHPGGRPSKYDPAYCEQARKLCELGATDYDLAQFFGVTDRTIYRWQNEHEEFCHALKAGKDPADDRVERSLFHKAVGYTFTSEKIFNHQGQIVRAETVEHVPPSDTAAVFWLKNRRKDLWRDRQPGDTPENPLHTTDVTDPERAAAVALLVARASKNADSDTGA